MSNRECEKMIVKEVERWPGVHLTLTSKGKHPRAVLEYNGGTRFVVYSATPSDGRAYKNKIADVRHACRLLGAARSS